jgi:hypothetical protein
VSWLLTLLFFISAAIRSAVIHLLILSNTPLIIAPLPVRQGFYQRG